MLKYLLIAASAAVAAAAFVLIRAYGLPPMTSPMPLFATALAFPAVYLLWEQSEP